MAKVRVEMDQGWVWWPEEPKPGDPTVEVPAEVLAEFHEVKERWGKLQDFLEHAYRHQLAFTPYEGSPYK